MSAAYSSLGRIKGPAGVGKGTGGPAMVATSYQF